MRQPRRKAQRARKVNEINNLHALTDFGSAAKKPNKSTTYECIKRSISKYSVDPSCYWHRSVAKFLRSGYSQMSLAGMRRSWLVDFFPLPAVRPTLIQLAAL